MNTLEGRVEWTNRMRPVRERLQEYLAAADKTASDKGQG
jgi:hypothetical protein